MKINWTLPLKIIYSILISCFFVVPAMVGYAMKVEVTRQSFWVLGVYGLIVFLFIFLQLVFATLNRIMAYRYKKTQPRAVSIKSSRVAVEAEKGDVEKKVENVTATQVNDTVAEIENVMNREQTVLSASSSQVDDYSTQNQQDSIDKDAKTRPATKMGLAVVGYREEPNLFTQCLESVKNLNYPDPFKIVVVVDGDEEQDKEMAMLFQKVFPNCPIVGLPELPSEAFQRIKLADEETAIDYDQLIRDTYTLPTDEIAVCYLQPHKGKRHAMYTAFRVLMAAGCEAVMSTDSDTKFDPNAMLEMESALHWFPNIGAAAGDVKIWNWSDSVLSFMSSLRYWMAFNIERSAQSFNRCVTCVSGPMGIYRSHVLKEILDKWITQSFLGMECTYGDDR
jgi:hyaluronan synthase